MFPHDARSGLLNDLSIGLRAIISQRLVRNRDGDLQPAVEILLNSTHIADLVKAGEIAQIKEAMEQSLYPGSQTFEQALYKLFKAGHITKEEALRNADSASNLSSLIDYSQTSKVKAFDPNAKQSAQPASSKADFEGIKLNIEVPPKT